MLPRFFVATGANDFEGLNKCLVALILMLNNGVGCGLACITGLPVGVRPTWAGRVQLPLAPLMHITYGRWEGGGVGGPPPHHFFLLFYITICRFFLTLEPGGY